MIQLNPQKCKPSPVYNLSRQIDDHSLAVCCFCIFFQSSAASPKSGEIFHSHVKPFLSHAVICKHTCNSHCRQDSYIPISLHNNFRVQKLLVLGKSGNEFRCKHRLSTERLLFTTPPVCTRAFLWRRF